jgi:hypothetical protein
MIEEEQTMLSESLKGYKEKNRSRNKSVSDMGQGIDFYRQNTGGI